MNIKSLTPITLCLGLSFSVRAQQTAFFFTSSPQSQVGQGQTVLVTPTNGFTFSVRQGDAMNVEIDTNGFPASGSTSFYLAFAMPVEPPFLLQPGTYLGATRYPFENPGTPGLEFIDSPRGDDTLTGSFTVLDVQFGPNNVVDSLAVDFIQYDNGNPAEWNEGSIRYNSFIPIPEPSPMALIAAGLLLTAAKFRSPAKLASASRLQPRPGAVEPARP